MRIRKTVWPLLAFVVLVGVLFAGVFPTQTFLAQRASTSHARKQLSVLNEQNAELERRAAELQSDAEIERLARAQYNLVKPGEEAYAVLPSPVTEGPERPAATPEADKDDGNVAQRAWRAVTGLF